MSASFSSGLYLFAFKYNTVLLFQTFLASNIILTPFFFMVIVSWVFPIVAPYDTCLDTLKSFFTDWGPYRTSVSYTVCPSCNFVFTEPFISHFIFWNFLTVTLISHFLTSVMFFFLYVMYDNSLLSLNNYLIYSSLFSSWTSPHNVAFTKTLSTS